MTNGWKILETMAPVLVYQKGSMVYWQGETAGRLYYLKKGAVKIFMSSENGSEQTLRVQRDKGVFGEAAFFDGYPRVSSARVLEKSEIVAVSREVLLSHIQDNPQLALYLMQALSETIRILSAQVDSMAFLQADKRIARFLMETLQTEENTYTIHCTNEELGARVGVSRVTVNRVLREFADNGWLETRYREIRVLQIEPLADFAFS
jgi:CRP/FNR family cyclic AMP-dependent transcriptional regulator